MIKVVEVVNNADNNHHRNNINDNKRGNFRIFLSVIFTTTSNSPGSIQRKGVKVIMAFYNLYTQP